MNIEEIKKKRIEAIKKFIVNNDLENLSPQEVANIYNVISHCKGWSKEA